MARILVVDDRATDREFLETLLGYAGHQVFAAGDGEEALRVARTQEPDLAIVDIVMPTMDGLEFVNRLRSDPKLSDTRVIFYSASFLHDEAIRLAVAGKVAKVLNKPAEPEQVLKVVNDVLGVKKPQQLKPLPPKFEAPERDALLSVTLHKTQRELESISQRLAVVVELAYEFATVSNPDQLLDRLAGAARAILGARYAVVGLVDENRDRFSKLFVSGLGTEHRGTPAKPDIKSGIFAELLRAGITVRRRVPGLDTGEFGLPVGAGRISALLAVPIVALDRILGLLCLLDKVGADEYSEDEAKVARAMASQVGIVYENIRLIHETERRLEYVNALRSIDVAITGSLDLRLTLDVVLDQVVSHLHTDAAMIMLYNRGSNHLEAAATRGFRSGQAMKRAVKLGDGHAGTAAVERQTFGFANARLLEADIVGPPIIAGERFEAYFVAPLVSKGRTLGVLEVFGRHPIDPSGDWMNFFEALAGQAAIAIDEAELFNDLQRANADLVQAYDSTLEGWVHALDLRDKETEGHTQRVTEVTIELARHSGMSDQEIVHVRRGALLHDIGKLGIPDAILLKEGPLSDAEWTIMKRHPTFAFQWLRPIAYLRPALDIPYCHHEKWDGSGYPRGLAGESIPMAARLFAAVDVWDALRSDRPYRAAWPAEKVRTHMHEIAGSHLDPDAVEKFFELIKVEG